MRSPSKTRERKENSATIPVAVRLRPEDEDRLAELQARLGGVSRGEVVRRALRELADGTCAVCCTGKSVGV